MMAVELVAGPRRCERCTGRMYPGYEGEFTCLWCGEVSYPPTPTLHGAEDVEAWKLRLRGKPGRPRRQAVTNEEVCA